ncbi:MAG: lysophospholipid acyltransferase family protein [Planctomycetaceae bacterium]|jgi:1-acyl-sn-glycerol-3-phosphate acyltransferase
MNATDTAAAPVPPRPPRRPVHWFVLQQLFRVLFAIWFRYTSRGHTHVPTQSPALLLSNHQSFLDPLLVGLPLNRPVSYLARDSLFRIFGLGPLMRISHVVPIKREGAGGGGLRETLNHLAQGHLMGIFPEGTRSLDGSVGPLKPGFSVLLRRVEVPVIPVGIAGANRAFGPGKKFIWPAKICVVYGEPIPLDVIAQSRERGQEDRLLTEVRQRIVDCQAQAEAIARG